MRLTHHHLYAQGAPDPYTVTATDITNVFFTNMYSGIELNGTTIGIAYTATLCEYLRSSVGVVQDGGAEMDQLISTTAHELGHIFAMIHDTRKNTFMYI